MNNNLLFAFIIILLSYAAYGQFEKSKTKEIEGSFIYFEPIFHHEKGDVPEWVYDRFEEISNIALDSVLLGPKTRFNVDKKYSLKLEEAAKKELRLIFNVSTNKQVRDRVTTSLKSLDLTKDDKYGVFFLVRTEARSKSNLTPISKVLLETMIVDFYSHKVVFYKKSKNLPPRGNGGYGHVLIKNLDYIFEL